MPIVVDARHQRRQQWRRRTTPVQLATWFGWLVGVALFAYCFQLISDRTIWAFVRDAPEQAGDLHVRMVPPQWSYMDRIGLAMWDTINIATLGTLRSILIAVPVAFLAARDTTHSIAFVPRSEE